jgi:two-component system phosphate regulon sensor histidine kinase PhoR
MNWIWFVVAAAAVAGVASVIWRRWIAPWTQLDQLTRQIINGVKPRTFVIEGSEASRRVALSLEELYKRQRDLDHRLAESTSGAETIFGAMQDGLLVVDASRRIVLVNFTLQNWFGLPGEIPTAPLLEVVRNSDIDRLIAETLRTGEPQRQELALQTAPNGAIRHMQLSAVATRTGSGSVAGAVALFHDITELKQTDEIRRDFVANVSHELRTPLSILRGYIETLLDDPNLSGEEVNRILEVMKKHSGRLNALTDDLLTLARLESANPNLQLEEVRLSELFAAIVRDWASKFADRKLRIDVNVACDVPVIQADATRLQEVLYNLLDNAVKYSEPNGRIRLQATRHNDQVALSVTDTGTGIGKADLPRIFERFYRTDKARSRELGGTGLGLSIVKHIAQMHGGSVEAESAVGQGTTIRVLLPVQPASTSAVTES